MKLGEIKEHLPDLETEANKARDFLLANPDRFFLCGSRYFTQKYPNFITVNDDTDWDFCCDDTPENRALLQKFQFFSVNQINMYPIDDLAVEIQCLLNVQVVIRSDSEKYIRVIDRIDPEFYRDFLWKSGPCKPEKVNILRIFNQLFRCAS